MMAIRKLAMLVLTLALLTTSHAQTYKKRIKLHATERGAMANLLKNNQFNLIEVPTKYPRGQTTPYAYNEVEQLLLLSGSFSKLLQFSKKHGSLANSLDMVPVSYKAVWLYADDLSQTLFVQLSSNEAQIAQQIDESTGLTTNEKAYLKLFLSYQILTYNFCDKERDNSLVYQSRLYLKQRPPALYAQSAQSDFNKKYYASKLKLGYYVNSGLIVPTQSLQHYLPNGIPINVGLSLHAARFALIGGYGPGIGGDLKQSIEFQKVWNQGDNITYAMGELYLGYYLVDSKKFGVMPYFGFNGAGLTPSSRENREYYDEVENIVPHNNFSFGANFEFRWFNDDCSTRAMYDRGAGVDNLTRSIRLGISYNNPQYDRDAPELRGNLLMIKVGYAWVWQSKSLTKTLNTRAVDF